MYPVCPERNCDAAFECFFGPDSGSLERFLEDPRLQWRDAVRKGARIFSTAAGKGARIFSAAAGKGARRFSSAVDELNVLLTFAWMLATYAFSSLAWQARSLRHFIFSLSSPIALPK
jgi:hypothetical protein